MYGLLYTLIDGKVPHFVTSNLFDVCMNNNRKIQVLFLSYLSPWSRIFQTLIVS